MQFIDTHIHLQDYKSKNAPQIMAQAVECGADKFICAATSENDWAEVEKLTKENPERIIPAFGIHPWHMGTITSDWEIRLEGILKKYPQALVGESGLDRIKNPEVEPQNSIFRIQIELAKCLNRSLIIHAVKVQDWLENYWKEFPESFVFHSYNGKVELLKKIVKANGYVSFSHSILRNSAREEILKTVPLEKLLIETDGPYQSKNDEESQPEQIPFLLKEIASIRGEEYQKLSEIVYQNSKRFINGKS